MDEEIEEEVEAEESTSFWEKVKAIRFTVSICRAQLI